MPGPFSSLFIPDEGSPEDSNAVVPASSLEDGYAQNRKTMAARRSRAAPAIPASRPATIWSLRADRTMPTHSER